MPDMSKVARSFCICDHTGDGPNGDHKDLPHNRGQGRCTFAGCDCTHFVWDRYTDEMSKYYGSFRKLPVWHRSDSAQLSTSPDFPSLTELWNRPSHRRLEWVELESALVHILNSELTDPEKIAWSKEYIDAFTQREHFDPNDYARVACS